MKKRITLNLALTVSENATIGDVLSKLGVPTGNIHVNHSQLTLSEQTVRRVLVNGEQIAYATEL